MYVYVRLDVRLLMISSCVAYICSGSRSPEFESSIQLRQSCFIELRQCKQQRAPAKSLVAGRPAPTPRGGRDLSAFQELCSDRSRTKAINYKSKDFKSTNEHDGRCCMLISVIAALILSRKVEKRRFSRKLTFDLP